MDTADNIDKEPIRIPARAFRGRTRQLSVTKEQVAYNLKYIAED